MSSGFQQEFRSADRRADARDPRHRQRRCAIRSTSASCRAANATRSRSRPRWRRSPTDASHRRRQPADPDRGADRRTCRPATRRSRAHARRAAPPSRTRSTRRIADRSSTCPTPTTGRRSTPRRAAERADRGYVSRRGAKSARAGPRSAADEPDGASRRAAHADHPRRPGGHGRRDRGDGVVRPRAELDAPAVPDLCERKPAEFCGRSLDPETGKVVLFNLDPIEGLDDPSQGLVLRRHDPGDAGRAVAALAVHRAGAAQERAALRARLRALVGRCCSCSGASIAFFTLEQALEFLISWAGEDVDPAFQVQAYIRLVDADVSRLRCRLHRSRCCSCSSS